MVAALFDTNIIIDYLRGVEAARDELSRYEQRSLSIVSWMEVLAGAQPQTEALTRSFLSTFQIFPLNEAIAERAVAIRRERKVKLPDAVIWATAETGALLLVTRNTKDFPEDYPGIRCPYQL